MHGQVYASCNLLTVTVTVVEMGIAHRKFEEDAN